MTIKVFFSEFSLHVQNFENPFLPEPEPLATLSTLNLTVLLNGRHSPTVTTSPTATSLKHKKQATIITLWKHKRP